MKKCSKKETTKKYLSRPSPAYPANECKFMKKKGNDGTMYKSVKNSQGVYRWQKASTTTKTTTRRKISSKCKKQTTKKYMTRKSPPYPANECASARRMGNDGKFYTSTKDVNNVYKWKIGVQ